MFSRIQILPIVLKRLSVILALAGTFIFLSSCNNEDLTKNGNVTCLVNGKSFVSQTVEVQFSRPGTSGTTELREIYARQNNDFVLLRLINTIPQVGTYSFFYLRDQVGSFDLRYNNMQNSTYTVNVTAVDQDAKRFSGTFTLEVRVSPGSSPTILTEGRFDNVKYDK